MNVISLPMAHLLLFLLVSLPLSASTLEVFFEVTSLGGNAYRYTYTPNNYLFLEGDELAILFPADGYGSISNGLPDGAPGWDLLLFQPNSPPGSPGVYSLYALEDGPAGPPEFSVEFTWLGADAPGVQAFLLNQYDPVTGDLLRTLQEGVTEAVDAARIPEPSSSWLLLAGGFLIRLSRARTSRRARR